MSFRVSDQLQRAAQLNKAASNLEQVNKLYNELKQRLAPIEVENEQLKQRVGSLEVENEQLHKELAVAYKLVADFKKKASKTQNSGSVSMRE